MIENTEDWACFVHPHILLNSLAILMCLHIFALRLYNNNITDVGAKLVAHIIEECPKLRIVKYVLEFILNLK